MANTNDSPRAPIRLWPGVVAAVLIVIGRVLLPLVWPASATPAMLGSVAAALIVVLWWLFFSRARWLERVGALVLMVVLAMATRPFIDPSIAGGMMGYMFFVYALPATLPLALVVWAVLARHRAGAQRWVTLAVAIAIGSGVWTLVRTGGVSGEGVSDLHWRWTPTPEERLLAMEAERPSPVAPPAVAPTKAPEPAAPPSENPAATAAENPAEAPAAIAPPASAADPVAPGIEWPGFRGPDRNAVARGVRIDTDWSASPPRELWRRPVGPGWSSFAVDGDLLYTQEQRGDHEAVSCYRLSTGEPVWQHRDEARFWESNGGAGPRATPTLHGGRVYTMGATGIVNVLDARNGARIWSRNAAADTKQEIPEWGLASSPLVAGDLVIAAAAGRLVAYDIASGEPRWFGPTGGGGYSSPHLARLGGVEQVLLLRGARTISVAPADGTLLWEYAWQPTASIVQPAVLPDGVLINTADAMGGQGLRRLAVAHGDSGWTIQERWTTRGLKPYFNDSVVHEGHAYGFDGTILAAIDLETGERQWKGGRYGSGQMLLLPEQDLLLILSEDGDLALVGATPDGYSELARVPAINGKSWSHPVLVGDVVLVRNGEEMAAFRLARPRR
jgi:outer membrane protein assembly factor BamB